MKQTELRQFVFRFIPGCPGVYDFLYGKLVDGQFLPLPFDQIESYYLGYIHVDDLLGTAAYVKSSELSGLIRALLDEGASLASYPQFFIANLTVDVEKEEENA